MTLYRIVVNIAHVFCAFNFRTSHTVQKYFNIEIFMIYGNSDFGGKELHQSIHCIIIAIQCQVSKRKIQNEIKTLWQKLELTLRSKKARVQRKEIQDRPVAVSTNITL